MRVKQEALAHINAKIKELEEAAAAKMREKEELTMKMKDCEVQLERAKKLTDGLSDEKERWTNDIERLKGNLDMLPGNSAVSASMLTYSGPFNAQYRQELE